MPGKSINESVLKAFIVANGMVFSSLFLAVPVLNAEENPLAGAEQFNPNGVVEGSGWANLYDPENNSLRLLPYLSINGMAIHESDIILGFTGSPADPAIPVPRGVAITYLGKRWEDGIVPYEILPAAGYSSVDLQYIQAGMDHIEEKTSIRFVQYTNENSYVQFQDGTGCSSYVGDLDSGAQKVELKKRGNGGYCTTMGIVAHELFHALGVFHEQSRSDRDQYVTINYANITAGYSYNFDVATGAEDIGAYDYSSIMHYGTHAFSSNGQPTITVPAGVTIGLRSELSQGDITTMQYMYYTDMQLELTTNVTEVDPGGPVDAVIDVSNHGDANIGNIIAKDVVVTMPISAGSSYNNFSSSESWNCQLSGQNVVCSLAILGRNASSRLSLNLTAPSNLNSMQLSPTVSVSNRDMNSANDSDSANITVTNLTDLAVAMSASSASMDVGDTLSVTLNLSNSSQVAAQQVTLDLTTAAALDYLDFSGSGWSCSNSGTATRCSLSQLNASNSSQIVLRFKAVAAINGGVIAASVSTQNTDGDPGNNTANTLISINTVSTADGGGGAFGGIGLVLLTLLAMFKRFSPNQNSSRIREMRSGAVIMSANGKPEERKTVKSSRRGVFLFALSVLAMTACQTPVAVSGEILYVDSKIVDCTGLVPQKCMRVRSSESAQWEYFYGAIEGFEYEAGYHYKLLIDVTEVKNPPQDASSLRYKLKKIIEKN